MEIRKGNKTIKVLDTAPGLCKVDCKYYKWKGYPFGEFFCGFAKGKGVWLSRLKKCIDYFGMVKNED
jgi:hypothetical protein